MADFNGVNYALSYVTKPLNPPDAAQITGKARYLSDSFLLAANADGSKFLVGRVQKGVLIHYESVIFHAALGASTTLALVIRNRETAVEQDLYAAEDSSAQGTVGGSGDEIAWPHLVDGDSDLLVELVGAAGTGQITTQIVLSANE